MHYTEMTSEDLADYSAFCATLDAPAEDEYVDLDFWGEDR